MNENEETIERQIIQEIGISIKLERSKKLFNNEKERLEKEEDDVDGYLVFWPSETSKNPKGFFAPP